MAGLSPFGCVLAGLKSFALNNLNGDDLHTSSMLPPDLYVRFHVLVSLFCPQIWALSLALSLGAYYCEPAGLGSRGVPFFENHSSIVVPES